MVRISVIKAKYFDKKTLNHTMDDNQYTNIGIGIGCILLFLGVVVRLFLLHKKEKRQQNQLNQLSQQVISTPNLYRDGDIDIDRPSQDITQSNLQFVLSETPGVELDGIESRV